MRIPDSEAVMSLKNQETALAGVFYKIVAYQVQGRNLLFSDQPFDSTQPNHKPGSLSPSLTSSLTLQNRSKPWSYIAELDLLP